MSLQDRLTATRVDFLDALEQRGFHRRGEAHAGSVDTVAGHQRITVRLSERWPFSPPSVVPDPPDARDQQSWHRELDGGLCLYTENDRNGLPWLQPDGFLAQVASWFDRNAAGWTNDAPDLDLDRYFHRADPHLTVLYDQLEPLVGRFVRLRAGRNRTLAVMGPGAAPGKQPRRGQVLGYCADIGAPSFPPRNWLQLAGLLQDAPRLELAVKRYAMSLLLLRYDRGGHEGVLALDAAPLREGGIRLLSQASASTAASVRGLRSGGARELLAEKSVAVVGCGAVGSFLVDQLVRAGIGKLTLFDDDTLRPANCVRHLAGQKYVGLTKAHAVRDVLQAGACAAILTCLDGGLQTVKQADELLGGHDLVIDATGDGAATALLRYAAEDRGTHVLSVCLQNDGTTLRVDIAPPLVGAAPLVPSPRRSPLAPIFEGGCGDPISLTPPHAVLEAAAMAVRHASALLTGAPLHPAGEIRDNPPPEPPQGQA